MIVKWKQLWAPHYTWTNHHVDGNSLFVGHEAHSWEDCEARNKAGAAVESRQPETVPAITQRAYRAELRDRMYIQVWLYNPTFRGRKRNLLNFSLDFLNLYTNISVASQNKNWVKCYECLTDCLKNVYCYPHKNISPRSLWQLFLFSLHF